MGFWDFLKKKSVEKTFPNINEQPQNDQQYQKTTEKISLHRTEKKNDELKQEK